MKSAVLESSVSETLNVMGDFWMLRLLGRLFLGATTWSELADGLSIPATTLKTRLTQLIETNCLRRVDPDGYELTEQGSALFPVIATMSEWSLRWDDPDGRGETPWMHSCGAGLRLRSICTCCRREIDRADAQFVEAVPRTDRSGALAPRHFRTAGELATGGGGGASPHSRLLQAYGDRRAAQLFSALSRGVSRFEDLRKATHLHPAVVAERLRKLQLLGFVYTRLYQEAPDRVLYGLLPCGQDLFPITMQMMHWGDRWIFQGAAPPVKVIHLPCKEVLKAVLVCASCGDPAPRETVRSVANPRALFG